MTIRPAARATTPAQDALIARAYADATPLAAICQRSLFDGPSEAA